MPIYPGKAEFPLSRGPGSDHDKLEAHLSKPSHAVQSVWNRGSVCKPTTRIEFLYFALEGRVSQYARANEAPVDVLQQSPLVFPNQDSVDGSVLTT